jgi:hypothetical protein
VNAARGPAPQASPVLRRYLLAGLLTCGVCGRRMESAWSNSKPVYRCRHGRTSAMAPDPARPKNTYVREGKLLLYLPALHLLLTSPATRVRRRTRAGADVGPAVSPDEVIAYLRKHEITLTWDPAAAARRTPNLCRRWRQHQVQCSRASTDCESGSGQRLVWPGPGTHLGEQRFPDDFD